MVRTGHRSPDGVRRLFAFLRRLSLASVAIAVAMLVLSAAVAAAPAAARSIVIVAPHPDDDLLYGAGVVSNALAAGDSVKIVYMTNGDLDGVASGLTREDEAVAGQAVLGTPENDLIFLGYPDTGLWVSFYAYTGSGTALLGVNGVSQTYGDRGLGRSDYHYYHFGSHGSYNRPSVLADLDSIFATYRPDDVYTTGPLDYHSDHSTTYAFVKQALLDCIAADPTYRPTLHSTIVHTTEQTVWPEAMNPTTPMTQPPGLPASGPQSWGTWEHLTVPAAMQSTNLATNPKVVAINKHSSQGGTGDFLGQFVHSDEIFWPEQLNAAPVNHSPTAVAGPAQTVAIKAAVTLDGSGSSDPDGDTITYAWTQTAGTAVTLSSATTAKPTFTAPATAGSLTFQLVVSDGKLSSTPSTVTITVQAPANRAPTAVAGPAQTVATQAAVQLDGSASSDPDGDTLTYAWTQTAGTAVTLSSTTTAKPTFTAPAAAGSPTFQLVVSDGKLSSTPSTVTITVTACDRHQRRTAATATASSQTTSTGQTAAKAIDGVIDGYPNDYTKEWATSGQGAGAWLKLVWPSAEVIDAVVLYDRPNTNDQITAATLTFSDGSTVPVGTLPNDDTGLTVSFTARSVTSVTLTVTAVSSTTHNVGLAEIEVDGHVGGGVNHAPTAVAGPAQTVATKAAVTLDGSASSDPDGDTITYAWTQAAGPAVTLSSTTTAKPTFTAPADATTLTFQLVVSDGKLSSTPSTVTITVQAPANRAPTAVAGPAQTVATKAAVTLDGSASSDPDGDTITYAWTQTGGTAVTLSSATVAKPTFTAPAAAGSLTFQLVVNDGKLSSSPSP